MAGVETSTGTTEAEDNPPVRRLADWSPMHFRELATEYGTPLYVIDVGRVRENAARFRRVFPNADIDYAVKANVRTPVLETLADMGFGIKCASASECESADTLARDRERPEPARGDLLAVGTAGAYGYEMASIYNSRPRPAVCTIDGADAEPCVRRETTTDLTRREQ